MRVQIKWLDGTRWKLLDLSELKGKSICGYMLETERVVIAALFENKDAVMFVSNDQAQVELYKEKGASLHASDLALLMGTDVVPIKIAQVFPDATFEVVEKIESKDPRKWWN